MHRIKFLCKRERKSIVHHYYQLFRVINPIFTIFIQTMFFLRYQFLRECFFFSIDSKRSRKDNVRFHYRNVIGDQSVRRFEQFIGKRSASYRATNDPQGRANGYSSLTFNTLLSFDKDHPLKITWILSFSLLTHLIIRTPIWSTELILFHAM